VTDVRVSASSAPFDATADAYDDDPHHAAVAHLLVGLLRSQPRPGLVVDVATGTGAAAVAARHALAPERVVAVDISPRMIERAAAKDPDGRIEWRVASAVPLDIADGAADVVLCASALHFLGARALPDWRRVLRPGGQLAFSVPAAADFHPSPAFRASMPADLDVPADPADAECLARDAGFTAVQVHSMPPGTRRTYLVRAVAP
jgi:ubiquinone/menaquinone biosynthesis C-methylase UbiE